MSQNKEYYSDLIYLTLDGEADGTQKNMLFHEIAENEELQNEFLHAVTIAKATSSDSQNYYPPSDLTNAVFLKSGLFSNGIYAPRTPIRDFFIEKAMPVLSSKAFLSVAAFSCGLICAFLLSKPALNNVPVNSEKPTKENIQQSSTNSLANINMPLPEKNTKKNATRIQKPKTPAVPIIANYACIEPKEELSENQAIVNNSLTMLSQPNINNEIGIRTEQLSNRLENSTKHGSILDDIRLGVKSINGIKYLPGRDLIQTKGGNLIDFCVDVQYKYNDKFLPGVQIGKEEYPIYLVENNGNLNPTSSVTYYALTLQYNAFGFNSIGKANTYSKAAIGYTKTGAIGKLACGLVWTPEYSLGMDIGVEGLGIVSSYNNKKNYTGKISFYYGIIFNF